MNLYVIIGLIYIVFIFLILLVSAYIPSALFTLSTLIKMGICIFLMIRFNPMQKKTCDEFDIKLVFIISFFLLTSGLIIETALYNLNKIQTYMQQN